MGTEGWSSSCWDGAGMRDDGDAAGCRMRSRVRGPLGSPLRKAPLREGVEPPRLKPAHQPPLRQPGTPSLAEELLSALDGGCPGVCPAALAGKAEPVCGAGETGTCRGLWLGWPSPPQSPGLLSPGSPEHRGAVPRCCVGTSFQGGLILWGPGSSLGVSHAEFLGGLGLCWLGGHRRIAPPPPPHQGCCLQPVSVVGHREPTASVGMAWICRAGIV